MVSRYPGAQPFADDELSRLVFRGRDRDAEMLLDLVLAHRLVVVYAKSGLGKTSLLQAGLAAPLRDEHYLPLLVRLNDGGHPPLVSLVASVEREAVRQGVEYHVGNTATLWHYFKTAEFWRGDVLLTPVLVLDQFEELFTLQAPEARADFLRGLGYLVRGVRPEPRDETQVHGRRPLSEYPPDVRVVISLREDFLGLLEEGADNIPQILDHRFRLKPLGLNGATDAVEAPAAIEDARFSTRPFRYGEGTTKAIVNYLAGRTGDGVGTAYRHVEPFHLQLICQRAEDIARKRQRDGVNDVTVTFDDLGGVPGLDRTLRNFYADVLHSIPSRSVRRRVERLCTDYLISPEGRRLSVEGEQIERSLTIDAGTLQQLVDRRLLRSDHRTDRSYYELSHDSLVQPILATSRLRGTMVGVLGLFGSGLLGLLALGVLLAGGLALQQDLGAFRALFGAAFVGLALWLAAFGARQSVETLDRYLPLPDEPSAPGRRRTVSMWLICVYSALPTIELINQVTSLAGGSDSLRLGSLLSLFLLSLKTAAFVGGAFALLRFRATAVPLFAVSLGSTIASMIQDFELDVSRFPAMDVLLVSASVIGLEVVILGYAWWLRKRRVLH